jgi:hypothetical protein
MQNNKKEAIDDFISALCFFGDSQDAGRLLSHFIHISLLEDEIKEAKNYLLKCYQVDPFSPQNLLVDCMYKIYTNNPTEALKILQDSDKNYREISDFNIFYIFPFFALLEYEEANNLYSENIHQVSNNICVIIHMHLRKLAFEQLLN